MTEMVNKFAKKRQIDVFYDFIIFNAALTQKDLFEMINFIRRIPTPFDQVSHHLTLGPEVALYHKFKEENTVLPRDLQKMYESNYHEFNFTEYQDFPNFYLNLIIEWMAGRHDSQDIGRLPRNPKNFLKTACFSTLQENVPATAAGLKNIALSTKDIRDFLLHPATLQLIENNNNVLKMINYTLPEIIYTNQKNYGVYRDN